MALSLRCVDCGAQLRSVKEAQDHGEATGHSNFEESVEAVLTLVCAECGKPCRSQVERDMHARTNPGHDKFVDETEARAHKMDTEGEVRAARVAAKAAAMDTDDDDDESKKKAKKEREEGAAFKPSRDPATFVEPAVDAAALEALMAMGFSRNKSLRALHFSSGGSEAHAGNVGGSVEGAVAWLEAQEAKVAAEGSSETATAANEEEQEKETKEAEAEAETPATAAADPSTLFAAQLEEPLLLPPGPPPKPKLSKEEAAAKAAEMLAAAKARRAAEEAAQEKEREANRIRAGKELLLAKRKEEELAGKRAAEARRLEKEEVERARLKVKEKLEEDRRSRRMALGLPPELSEEEKAAEAAKEAAKVAAEAAKKLPVKSVSALSKQREILVSIKKAGPEEKAKACFETLFKIVANVGTNPTEPKFRRLRLGNAALHARVFSVPGALDFLGLVGFAKETTGEAGQEEEVLLVLPEEKARPADLQEVASLLDSAMNNPMFGAL